MDPAVGVVLGALIGAGGTVVTTFAAARTARATIRAQGEVQKNQWLDDSRRAAYTEFLTASTALHGSWWTLAEAIKDGSGEEERRRLLGTTYELWKALQGAFAVVQIMGPENVTARAKAVFVTLTAMDNSGASWCDKVRNGDEVAAQSRLRDFLTAHAAYDVTAFASAASAALSG